MKYLIFDWQNQAMIHQNIICFSFLRRHSVPIGQFDRMFRKFPDPEGRQLFKYCGYIHKNETFVPSSILYAIYNIDSVREWPLKHLSYWPLLCSGPCGKATPATAFCHARVFFAWEARLNTETNVVLPRCVCTLSCYLYCSVCFQLLAFWVF